MKKILFIVLCLCICGCQNNKYVLKSEYNDLQNKYNELKDEVNVDKEKEYIQALMKDCSVSKKEFKNDKILEIFCEPISVTSTEISSIMLTIGDNEWFNYDYVFLHMYGFGKIYGTMQFDRNGILINTTEQAEKYK